MQASALKSRLANILAASPCSVTCEWNSKTFSATRSNLKQELRYSDIGYGSGYEFSVVCSKDDLGGTLPKDKDLITVDGESKRIMLVEEDAAKVAVTLQIGDLRG